MSLSPEQRLTLISMAREHWLEAQRAAYAYERAVSASKQRTELLKIGTIIAALLTAASGFANRTWLTVIAGLVTTALATAERLYSPATDSQKYWECRTELDGVQQSLRSFSVTFEAINDLTKGAQPLDQLGQQIVNIKRRMPVAPTDDDTQKALQAFSVVTMSQIVNRAIRATGATPQAGQETTLELPEDAPDVVAVYRSHAGR